MKIFSRALAVTAATALGVAGAAGAVHASVTPSKARAAVTAAATGAKPYDFNGDGYSDLALGSPNGKVGGYSGAGFVSIVYGSGTGANTKKKTVISQNTAGVPGVAESGDHFGFALTSFDYDRDGYADLLVGSPDEDTSKGKDAGSETILWGSRSGLTGAGSGVLGEPANAGAGHRFGYAITTGDFDHDGYTDWVDTSPGDAYFWTFTSAPALRTARAFQPAARSHAVRGVKGEVTTAAVTKLDALLPVAADVNGDGRTDLVLGWRNSLAEPKYQYGFDVWTDISQEYPANEVLTKVDGLTAGDFDGDGYADVAAGAADDSGRAHSHLVVFKGDASTSMSDSYMINQETPGVPGTTALGDRFGASLSAGDVNHDGRADLAVGVPGRKLGSVANAGVAITLYGSASGLTGNGSQGISQSTPGVPGTAEANDVCGTAVALLDITKDGRADLIVGAPGENSKDGVVSVLLGTASGVTGKGSATFGAGTFGVTTRTAQIGLVIGNKS